MAVKFDPRSEAARLLRELERRDGFAEAMLDAAFTRGRPEQLDRSFTTALVYGVLRLRYRLDRHIEEAAKRRIEKIDPTALSVLRVGAFQLLAMDRVPASAAVDTSVKAAKNLGAGHAAGFVNAVLRRISEGSVKPVPVDEADAFALEYSIPPWLARHWIERETREGAELLARHAALEPPVYLNLDTRKISRYEAVRSLAASCEAGTGTFAPDSVWVRGGGDPRALPPVAQGLALVQGQASQLIAPLLNPAPGMRILDACAAPGMKTLHLARLMNGEGTIKALDIHPHRTRMIEEAAKARGFGMIEAVCADASEFDDTPFDAVLADVPCTGLGVLSRNPERKWRVDPTDPERLSTLQSAILDNLSRMVRPGGIMVYATCTTTREENETVVEKFLAAHPEFKPLPVAAPAGLVDGFGRLRTFPRDTAADPADHLDGFFAARFTRG